MPMPAQRHNLRLSRKRLVDILVEKGITDKAVLKVLLEVPRHSFVPDALYAQAYEDTPLPIGYGQTISQPFVVALMTQALEVRAGMRVLEIGTGSGYQAAVLAAMGCKVFTVERIRELHQAANTLFQALGLRNIHTCRDDGTLGLPEAAPFDRILVTAGGPSVPEPLLGQLEDPGILVIPVGKLKRQQRLLRVRQENGKHYTEDLGGVIFVDLVGQHAW